jgi:putative oxidoreductase
MALHGWSKYQQGSEGWLSGNALGDMLGTTLAKVGLISEPWLAWLVLLTELIGGVLLVLGLLTRISATAIAIVLIIALTFVKGYAFLTPGGVWNGEIDWVLFFGALALMFVGPGAISIDKLLGIDD